MTQRKHSHHRYRAASTPSIATQIATLRREALHRGHRLVAARHPGSGEWSLFAVRGDGPPPEPASHPGQGPDEGPGAGDSVGIRLRI